jgi:hypothetical protein
VIAISADDERVEVGHIGREGMTGEPVILGLNHTPNETFIQVAGSGLRMQADGPHGSHGGKRLAASPAPVLGAFGLQGLALWGKPPWRGRTPRELAAGSPMRHGAAWCCSGCANSRRSECGLVQEGALRTFLVLPAPQRMPPENCAPHVQPTCSGVDRPPAPLSSQRRQTVR